MAFESWATLLAELLDETVALGLSDATLLVYAGALYTVLYVSEGVLLEATGIWFELEVLGAVLDVSDDLLLTIALEASVA
jgi:hypothetical protein